MTYNWEITGWYKQDVNGFVGVVTSIQFRLIATTDDNIISSYAGSIVLDTNNLNQESFISLNELDNTKLLEWLENYVTSDEIYWNHINEFIDTRVRLNRINDLGTKMDGSL